MKFWSLLNPDWLDASIRIAKPESTQRMLSRRTLLFELLWSEIASPTAETSNGEKSWGQLSAIRREHRSACASSVPSGRPLRSTRVISRPIRIGLMPEGVKTTQPRMAVNSLIAESSTRRSAGGYTHRGSIHLEEAFDVANYPSTLALVSTWDS